MLPQIARFVKRQPLLLIAAVTAVLIVAAFVIRHSYWGDAAAAGASQGAYFDFLPFIRQDTAVAPPLPDLIVEHVTITLEDTHCFYGQPLGIRVWVRNVGEGDAGPFVVDVNGDQVLVAEGLTAGAVVSLWFSGYVHGTEQRVEVDATFLVTESHEDNNIFLGLVPIPTPPIPCTPTATTTGTPTPTAIYTGTPTPTNTPILGTATPTGTPTSTPISGTITPTRTPIHTATPRVTRTPTPTSTPTPAQVNW